MAEKIKGSGNYRKLRVEPGDNAKFLSSSLGMWAWEKPDMTDPAAVQERIYQYFQHCIDTDVRPSMEGFSLAFSITRRSMYNWIHGIESAWMPDEIRAMLKKAYGILNVQMADYMQNGKIHPVAGIFLMKNNMDYEDKKEITVAPTQNLGEEVAPELLREKYLHAIEAETKALPLAAEVAEEAEEKE